VNNEQWAKHSIATEARLAELDAANLPTDVSSNGSAIAALNDLSAADVNAEVDTALADYDPPTKAELDSAVSPLATAANQTTILNRLGAWTGSGVNTILGALKALASKAASAPSDIGGTFDPAADSTEAIRDRGDAAWGSGSGGDWTANERTAIKAVLGVDDDTAAPGDPTSGILDTIRDSIAALGAGTGAAAITLTVEDGSGNPVQGVPVTLQASGGVNVQVSDENGEVVFNRDDGSWAYVIADTAAYTGASGTVVVASGAVTAPAGGILTVTAISLPVPTSPDCYLLYAQERKADDGDAAFGAGEVTVKVLRIEFPGRLDSAASSVRTVVGEEYQTDASGVWSFELAKTAFASGALLVLERAWEDAEGNPDSEIWQVTLDDAAATVDDQICLADLAIRRGQ
jgi:hypothetical protein